MKFTFIIIMILVSALTSLQAVELKKKDKEREEMIKNKYLGTGVGEAKAEQDANYGIKQNISELGNAFDSMAKRIEAQTTSVTVQKELPPTAFTYATIGTWFSKVREKASKDGISVLGPEPKEDSE